jgi:hypothetical protein
MAKFVVCNYKSVRLHNGSYFNCPVNIDMCTSIKPNEEVSGYGHKYAVLTFYHGDVRTTWNYGENGIEERDKQFLEILNSNK